MTETVTLVHMSDVHLGPVAAFAPRYWNAKRALGLLNWHRKRVRVHVRQVADRIAADALAQRPDHIAVTGDLANLGLPHEYEAARAWLETLGDPEQVSVVPGNHDIYTGRMHGASCLASWAPYMRDGGKASSDDPVRFPYVRKVGPIAIVGVCSAVPTPPFVAAGRVGPEQRVRLAQLLDGLGQEGLIRVVLIHHPPLPGQSPPRRALEDARELSHVLGHHGAELVLHGHNHCDMLACQEHKGHRVPVLGVASASAAIEHGAEPLARYHAIRIARSGGEVAIAWETRGLTSSGGEIGLVGRHRADLPAPVPATSP
jgi:3',5'-cyclic AMP phosphodiesterase CpdA